MRRALARICSPLLSLITLCATCAVWAAPAEVPVLGGLGVQLGVTLPDGAVGAELTEVPEALLPPGTNITLPLIEPGGRHPWQHFNSPNIPRLYRDLPVQSFVMVNDAGAAMRVIARVNYRGCDEKFDWLKNTISKKYKVRGDAEVAPPAGYERALRIAAIDRQIEVRCGPRLVLDYLDLTLIKAWSRQQGRRWAVYQRDQAAIAKRQLVLDQRRAVKFADSFTLGNQYRLDGAFGIYFKRQFAARSTQQFPIDQPFYAVLPNLPEPFVDGEILLTISPEGHPIVIRGTFDNLDFEYIAKALKAKYGTPMKASSRHIIHKVSGNHAIVKKIREDLIELAFVDTNAKEAQRARLWAQESEGL